jgi:hypothetical protein
VEYDITSLVYHCTSTAIDCVPISKMSIAGGTDISVRTAVTSLLSDCYVSRSRRYHYFLVEDLVLLECDTVIPKVCTAFIFSGVAVKTVLLDPSTLGDEALQSSAPSGTVRPVRQHHISEDLNTQQHHREIPFIVFKSK